MKKESFSYHISDFFLDKSVKKTIVGLWIFVRVSAIRFLLKISLLTSYRSDLPNEMETLQESVQDDI